MQNNSFKYLDLITAFFAVILVTSNAASSAKIVSLGFSLFGITLAFDGGTLLFPLSYVLGDILTEVYGFRAARRVIWTGFACLALSALMFFILQKLPSDPHWESYTGSAAYKAILGGMSSGAIVLASLAAYLAGEFSNSILLSKMKVLFRGRFLWIRTIGSSVIGELLDSLVFVGIASLAGVFGRELFLSLVFTNYLLKLSLEIILTPFTYLAVGFLKKTEGIDVYDKGIKYRLI
ncbi:MAG: queuosine precursor transporter [Treponema sp.]|jgi:uncharacterized integral membrane protein (TIGR00697 family)|nr:queuosine precursor transporter [Treponema sp.]